MDLTGAIYLSLIYKLCLDDEINNIEDLTPYLHASKDFFKYLKEENDTWQGSSKSY